MGVVFLEAACFGLGFFGKPAKEPPLPNPPPHPPPPPPEHTLFFHPPPPRFFFAFSPPSQVLEANVSFRKRCEELGTGELWERAKIWPQLASPSQNGAPPLPQLPFEREAEGHPIIFNLWPHMAPYFWRKTHLSPTWPQFELVSLSTRAGSSKTTLSGEKVWRIVFVLNLERQVPPVWIRL